MNQTILFEKLIHLVGEIQNNRVNKAEFEPNEQEKHKKHGKHGGRGKHEKHEKHEKSDKHDMLEKHEKHEKHRRHKSKMSPVSRNVLTLLLKEDNVNQRTLAQNCRVSGQAISDSIKKLEEHELIVKAQGEVNNENLISLTQRGREKAEHLQNKMQRLASDLFDGFTQDELESFTNLVEKLENNHEKFANKIDEESV